MRYLITNEDLLAASNFAKASYKHHLSHGRSEKEVFQNIITGKLGEIAYHKIVGDEVNEVNLIPSEDPDPGWDFIAKNGDRIQVKTVQPNYRWVSFGNYYWDRLVVMKIDGNVCTLLRDMHITEVKSLSQKSKFNGWYIPSYKI